MDQLPPLGTAISDVVMPTFKIYAPLLLENKSAIKSTKRETFSYGPNPRQTLDIYYPSSEIKNAPVFVFLYGGGLVRGDKILPMIPEGLAHANVGHFIAETLGCIAVIPDYRLISHGAVFPSGGVDVDLVVSWIGEKFVGQNETPRDLFMMGNSAGGIHLSTWLYASTFGKSKSEVLGANAKALRLKGVVMLSVPFHFRKALPDRAETLRTYYGNQIDDHCPLGLCRALLKANQPTGDVDVLQLPHLVLNGTLDPEGEILEPREDYLLAWKERARSAEKSSLKIEMMEGQNHISPPLSLGTGRQKEEAWGYQVQDWMCSIKG